MYFLRLQLPSSVEAETNYTETTQVDEILEYRTPAWSNRYF